LLSGQRAFSGATVFAANLLRNPNKIVNRKLQILAQLQMKSEL
jgi:hypothetical protein